MPVTGVHALLYTSEPDALRSFLRALGWPHVEAHDPPDGWQIYALPPAELGVHPSEGSTAHELTLMCDDLNGTLAELQELGAEPSGEPREEGFGVCVTIVVPGGVELLLYEPRHPTAIG